MLLTDPTLGVDADEFEPPLPVKQVVTWLQQGCNGWRWLADATPSQAPPPLHGGADRRSPWSLEFWLEVLAAVVSLVRYFLL